MKTTAPEHSAGQPLSGRKTKSILLIDDDAELCSLMAEFFMQHGFLIEAAHDGRRGLARAAEGGFDMVILDGMLPLLDGFEVLRQLRKRSSTPVIMLTARTAQRDRVMGLDTGADDYLPKPFDPDELLARIRAVLRRTGKEAIREEVVEAAGFTLASRSREVRYLKNLIDLTSLEFEILELLMRAAGRVVSRDELVTTLHHRQPTPWERSLDVHISHLRKKLESTGMSPIRTVRGVGYLFTP